MKRQQGLQFRLMTYNIGLGRKDSGSELSGIIEVVQDVSPDILVIQEAEEFQDADDTWHSTLNQIAQVGEFGKHIHFEPTLSMREHMHVRKALFVHGIFSDWQDWRQGNAILSRWEFVRLGDPSKPGVPRNVPLYLTPLYQGSRDTDPRYVLLARVNRAPIFPFVAGVHFTTLVAEREREEGDFRPLPGRFEEAQILRFKQSKRLLDLLKEHVLQPGKVAFLLGDFNAIPSELCMSVLEDEGGFVRLIPTEGPSATHLKAPEPIDHIFVHPRNRLLEYHCWVVNDSVASDHRPVVADVWVSCS